MGINVRYRGLIAMRKECVGTTILVFLAAAGVHAQSSIAAQLNPLDATSNGVHLYGVSVSAGYFTGNYAAASGGTPLLYGAPGQKSLTTMAGASFGWTRSSARSGFSVVYSPTLVEGIYFNRFHTVNHSLAMSASRELSRRWQMGASVSAAISDFSQLLFAPTGYGSIASANATFDELASAFLTGTTSNGALSALVSSAQPVTAPQNAYLYGARIFTAAANANLTFRPSERSTFTLTAGGSRAQNLPAPGNADNRVSVVSRTTSGNIGLGWSYSLTPRTQMGISISSGRTFSSYADAYTTQASVSLGRKMSRRWFLNGSAGAGYITPVYEARATPRNLNYLFSAGLGFKTYTHSFVGSYGRTISDVYGLGANGTDSASVGWTWKRPGQPLSLFATAGYMRLLDPRLPNAESWMASAGVSRALGKHFGIGAAYTHLTLPQTAALLITNGSEQGVMVSVSWSPGIRR